MEEYELEAGDGLVIPGVGRLTLKDVEGDAALLAVDLDDPEEERRLAAKER